MAVERGPDPYGNTVVAPLIVGGERIGRLAAFYGTGATAAPGGHARGRARSRASSPPRSSCRALAAQEERLAQAELRALRAQISPHFIYNALAAVANSIHTRPEEARELLTEFAEFTRYAFRGNRSYVTLADELHYVEKYLRLEKARFGDRLDVRVSVAPEVLTAVVPVLSMQPLVENAVRHGVEKADRPVPRGDPRRRPRRRRRADGPRRRRGHDRRGGERGARGPRRRHRARERPRAAAVDVRARVRARGRVAARRRDVVKMLVPKFRAGVRAA